MIKWQELYMLVIGPTLVSWLLYCSIFVKDVNIWGNWVKGMQELSVLFLQLSGNLYFIRKLPRGSIPLPPSFLHISPAFLLSFLPSFFSRLTSFLSFLPPFFPLIFPSLFLHHVTQTNNWISHCFKINVSGLYHQELLRL